MFVTQDVLEPLCDFGALSDNGLVIARLADEKTFSDKGVDKHAMMVSHGDNFSSCKLKSQLLALMWEVARRYNETYRYVRVANSNLSAISTTAWTVWSLLSRS
jgi:hypothetical protein